jgi:putative transposase
LCVTGVQTCALPIFISAACFEHRPLLATTERLAAFEGRLLDGLLHVPWADVRAWVAMPTHYHVLARLDLSEFRAWVHRLHNSTATVWNREDQSPGRRVWYRFGDRRIRGERHYWATVNYLHANPVRHKFAKKATEWPFSSVHRYMDDFGTGKLISLWKEYPVDCYGDGWDE